MAGLLIFGCIVVLCWRLNETDRVAAENPTSDILSRAARMARFRAGDPDWRGDDD